MPREFVLPGTRARYLPDRPWQLTHVKLDLELDFERQSIEGSCALTLEAVRATDIIALDAFELDVSAVRVGRKAVPFTNDGKELRAQLAKPARRGQSVTVTVSYSTTPRRGLYFVAPDEAYPDKQVHAWSQGQDDDSPFWFPCIDRPSMKATSEVVVHLPPSFTALSNGALVSDAIRKGKRRIHWRFDTPHSCYLITLVAGEFVVKKAKHKKVEVSYWLQPGREADGVRTLARTPEMIDLFSRLFGVPYPYEKYAQIFVSDFIFGGMENTTATTLTDVILLDKRAALDFDMERLVAHELAHQWFGDLITCRDWGQGWLNEGFATYSEYLWREHASGLDAAFVELDGWAESYFREDSHRYRRTVVTNLYDAPLDVFDAHLYQKGGRILHMLRQILGDDDFFAALAHYLEAHRFGAVETHDLARAIEESTGRSVGWFFDQWITKGAGHPELTVKARWDAEKKAAEITLEQTQTVDSTTPLFRLPMKVRFRLGKRDHDVDFELDEERRVLVVPLAREPSQIIVDPGRPTLAKIRWEKSPTLWVAELAKATDAADRITAARALGRLGGQAATKALVRAVSSDSFWGVRAAAARALGATRNSRALATLIKHLTGATEPRVRRAVAAALGEFRNDPKASAALAALLESGDPSYFVEADAALALGRARGDGAQTVLRKVATRDSFMDIVRRNAYAGLAELGDISVLGFLLDGTERGHHPRGRCSAALSAARLAANRGDHHGRRARERLEELLFDADFLVQLSAVEALGILGDAGAVPGLEALAGRDLDGRLRRRCRELTRDLREGRSQQAQMAELQAQIDALRTESVALRDRIEHLEAKGGGVVK